MLYYLLGYGLINVPAKVGRESITMKFNDYLSQKRQERKLTIRKLALKIGISSAFLCDLESGSRSFPANSKKYPDLLERIIVELELDEKEKEIMIQLAHESMLERDKISPEIKGYLQSMPKAQEALRKAAQYGATNEAWELFIKSLEEDK